MLDAERCYRVVRSRDARFDGWFVTAVTSTGIYCRPSCPAVTPKRANVVFHQSPAAAQQAGFRACRRCRPDAVPGSPEWNARADLVGRAMRLIADGVVDRDGVAGLAQRLGYSERQVHRQLVAEVGAGPQALARAQRAQTARVLLETTDLPAAQAAFAAGFASVRQYNETVSAVFGTTPTGLRAAAGARRGRGVPTGSPAPGTLTVRLAYRPPLDLPALLHYLAVRAVPGVEECDGQVYRRTLRLPRGTGVVELRAGGGPAHVSATFALQDLRDLSTAVQRCRRLLDLDADPLAVDEQLGTDPFLRPLVVQAPGRRSPGTVDGDELAVRAVIGQQVSVAGARTLAARLVQLAGQPLPTPSGALTHVFPSAAELWETDPARLPFPAARRRALHALAAAVADGGLRLDPGADRDGAVAALQALPGIGPWTAGYVRLRALGDPDAFLPTDLGVRRALHRLGGTGTPAAVAERARAWSPWRAYALHHLWAVPPTSGTAREAS